MNTVCTLLFCTCMFCNIACAPAELAPAAAEQEPVSVCQTIAADAPELPALPNEADAPAAEEARLLETLELSLITPPYEGFVAAVVKNKFTLFSSTVEVYLYLYSSVSYPEDIMDMEMETWSYITDLDMGNTLYAEAATHGQAKYWVARARVSVNGGDWDYMQTKAFLFNADGTRA